MSRASAQCRVGLTYGGSMEEKAARRCLERALELGVNFIDTANVYGLSQLALAWCLRRREVTSVIAGATSDRHVGENVAAADLEIDPAVFTALERVLEPVTAPRSEG